MPDDFVEFYKICNGFYCNEDIFNMKSIEDMLEYPDDYAHNRFYFSDYMINLDLWALRYRPNHVFEYNKANQLLQTYIGDIIFEGAQTIEPGEEREVTVRFLMNQRIEKYLDKGPIWWFHEVAIPIGQAKMI